jgi:hypothetical protein
MIFLSLFHFSVNDLSVSVSNFVVNQKCFIFLFLCILVPSPVHVPMPNLPNFYKYLNDSARRFSTLGFFMKQFPQAPEQ